MQTEALYGAIPAPKYLPSELNREAGPEMAREIHNRNGQNIGHVFVPGVGMVMGESLLEQDAARYLRGMPGVTWLASQPATHRYRVDGKPRRWTPDYEVEFRGDTPLYVEVKPTTSSIDEARHRELQKVSEQTAHRFLLLTEGEIRREPGFSHRKLLWRYARYGKKNPAAILSWFKAKPEPISIADLCVAIGGPQVYPLVLNAVFYGSLRTEDGEFLSHDSKVWAGQ